MLLNRMSRMTYQRKVILEELKKVSSHPTADEVYEMVRQRLQKISLGTIYRNLEFLAEAGLIQKLELVGTQKRFDGNIESHYHLRCLCCGCVKDVPIKSFVNIEDNIKGFSNYEIIGHRLELIGLCPECKRKDPNFCKRNQRIAERRRNDEIKRHEN